MVSSKYRFSLQTGAKPGEFDRIFSSKEAFQEACFADFVYPNKDNVLIRGWEEILEREVPVGAPGMILPWRILE